MVETLQKIWIGELSTVRIHCTNCKSVTIEAKIEDIGKALKDGKCPSCGTNLETTAGSYQQLSDLFQSLRKESLAAKIEFILPVP